MINHNFSQQVLSKTGKKVAFEEKNPFVDSLAAGALRTLVLLSAFC